IAGGSEFATVAGVGTRNGSMGEAAPAMSLFAAEAEAPGSGLAPLRTGILPFQAIRQLVREHEIVALPEIAPDQVQPASLDLRLGTVAYRVRASFLPGPEAT